MLSYLSKGWTRPLIVNFLVKHGCAQEQARAAWTGQVRGCQLSPPGQDQWLCTGRIQCRAAGLYSSWSWSQKRNLRAPAPARRPAIPMVPSPKPPGAAAFTHFECISTCERWFGRGVEVLGSRALQLLQFMLGTPIAIPWEAATLQHVAMQASMRHS